MTDDSLADSVRAQVGPAYDTFTLEERALHAALLLEVTPPAHPLALHADEASPGRWRVTLSSPDALGLLSVVAGTFNAAGLDIETADVFTVRVPEAAPERRARAPEVRTVARSLDVFTVHAAGTPRWD